MVHAGEIDEKDGKTLYERFGMISKPHEFVHAVLKYNLNKFLKEPGTKVRIPL